MGREWADREWSHDGIVITPLTVFQKSPEWTGPLTVKIKIRESDSRFGDNVTP